MQGVDAGMHVVCRLHAGCMHAACIRSVNPALGDEKRDYYNTPALTRHCVTHVSIREKIHFQHKY